MSEYAKSGVSHERKDAGLSGLVRSLKGTLGNNPRCRPSGDGYYASVLELPGLPYSIAISTDGVGTKVLVAQLAGVHDTVGIDLVAMNANDVVCVGADPLAMVDYIGVDGVDAAVFEQLGRGLAEGARRAEISIPGGEIAQVKDLVRGVGDGCHYDLIGTCVGIVASGQASDGSLVVPGDVVVGIASSGLHSNGFSLARRVIFEKLGLTVSSRLEECGRTVAEELLEPTAMYVREAKALLAKGVPVHAFGNITGGGLANLLRVGATGVGFLLDTLPEPQPIFTFLQRAGGVSAAEMHQVFNLGVGFCVVVPEAHAAAVIDVALAEGKGASVIGRVVRDAAKRCVIVRPGEAGCLIAARAKGEFTPAAQVPAEFRA